MSVYLVYSKKGADIRPDTVRIVRGRELTNIAALRKQVCDGMRPGYEFNRVIGHYQGLTVNEVVESGLFDLNAGLATRDNPLGHLPQIADDKIREKFSLARIGCTFSDIFPEIEWPSQDASFIVPAGSYLDGKICLQKDRDLFLMDINFLRQFSAMKRRFGELVNASHMFGDRFIGEIGLNDFSRHIYPTINAHCVPLGSLVQIPSAPVIEAMLQNEGSLEKIRLLGIKRLLTISRLNQPNSWSKEPAEEDRAVNFRLTWPNNLFLWRPAGSYRTVNVYDPGKSEYCSAYSAAPNSAVIVEKIGYDDFLSKQKD